MPPAAATVPPAGPAAGRRADVFTEVRAAAVRVPASVVVPSSSAAAAALTPPVTATAALIVPHSSAKLTRRRVNGAPGTLDYDRARAGVDGARPGLEDEHVCTSALLDVTAHVGCESKT